MTQALNGAGDTKTPTWINIICFWLLQVPLAYTLARTLNLGFSGAVMSVPIAESLLALIAWYFFYRGGWKKVEV